MGEGELALAAPGAAIVEEEDVETVTAERLRDIKVFLVSRIAVKEDDRRVRALTICEIGDAIQPVTMAFEVQLFNGGREFRVHAERVVCDRRCDEGRRRGFERCAGRKREPRYHHADMPSEPCGTVGNLSSHAKGLPSAQCSPGLPGTQGGQIKIASRKYFTPPSYRRHLPFLFTCS